MTAPLILFDLDGTLVDSAPDLACSLNRLRQEKGLPPLDYATIRPHAGMGARGMLKLGFGLTPEDPDFAEMRERFFDDYATHCSERVVMFDGIGLLLTQIESAGWKWGIVTNKHSRFTYPVLEKLQLAGRAAVVACGDTTGKLKPNPDNLLYALNACSQPASEALYVGDDLRDCQAARACDLPFVAASWGYLGAHADIESWHADFIAADPQKAFAWFNGYFG